MRFPTACACCSTAGPSSTTLGLRRSCFGRSGCSSRRDSGGSDAARPSHVDDFGVHPARRCVAAARRRGVRKPESSARARRDGGGRECAGGVRCIWPRRPPTDLPYGCESNAEPVSADPRAVARRRCARRRRVAGHHLGPGIRVGDDVLRRDANLVRANRPDATGAPEGPGHLMRTSGACCKPQVGASLRSRMFPTGI